MSFKVLDLIGDFNVARHFKELSPVVQSDYQLFFVDKQF